MGLLHIEDAGRDTRTEPDIDGEVLFDETDENGLFQQIKYMIRCEAALTNSTTIKVTAVIETGTGPSLIGTYFLPPVRWIAF